MAVAGHVAEPLDAVDAVEVNAQPRGRAARLVVVRRAVARAEAAHAGQVRASGEPYVRHALAVARILSELGLDHEVLAAAILHDVAEDTGITLDDLKAEFGARKLFVRRIGEVVEGAGVHVTTGLL